MERKIVPVVHIKNLHDHESDFVYWSNNLMKRVYMSWKKSTGTTTPGLLYCREIVKCLTRILKSYRIVKPDLENLK
jgi:hypothetical protein